MNNNAIYLELATAFKEIKNLADKYSSALTPESSVDATAMVVKGAVAFADAVIGEEDKENCVEFARDHFKYAAYAITELAACDLIVAIGEFEKKAYCNAIIAEIAPQFVEHRKAFDAAQALLKEIKDRSMCLGEPTLMYAKQLTKCVEDLWLYKTKVLDREDIIREKTHTKKVSRRDKWLLYILVPLVTSIIGATIGAVINYYIKR